MTNSKTGEPMGAQHTPGPWETRDGYLVGSDGSRVLFSGHLGLCLAPLPATNPNDALARAAPELLEAAEMALQALVGIDATLHKHGMMQGVQCPAIPTLEAVIAKARGAAWEGGEQ